MNTSAGNVTLLAVVSLVCLTCVGCPSRSAQKEVDEDRPAAVEKPIPAAAKKEAQTSQESPRLRLDPGLSTGVVPFGEIKLKLELGSLTVGKINEMLRLAHDKYPDAGQRFSFIVDNYLLGAAFEYESLSEALPAGTMRVRLESFGCTAFVLYSVALCSARNFEEFAHNLRLIRYQEPLTRGVDNDAVKGNKLDFAYNMIVDQAVKQGFLTEITARVAGKTRPRLYRTRITPRRRMAEHDPRRSSIAPKLNSNKVVSLRMISRANFAQMDRSTIKTGDVIIYSRVDRGGPVGSKVMVGHLALALKIKGEIYMTHATRDYAWRPRATKKSKPYSTGVYYLEDHRREQLGVSRAIMPATDPRGINFVSRIGGVRRKYWGYTEGRLRPIHHYMGGANIRAVAFFRVKNLDPARRASMERFLRKQVRP